MRRLVTLWRSLIGKKILMATTGLVLFLFVLGHLAGNLKVFEGPARFNGYAEGLRTIGSPFFARGELLWIVRVVLVVSVGVHIWAAAAVTEAGWRARPIPYRSLAPVATTYAARTMRVGGVLLGLYVVFHLLDLTFGRLNPAFEPGNVYHNVLASFRVWPTAFVYVVAMIVLGLHLYHGLWSALQTLGVNRPPTDHWRRSLAAVVAGAVAAGYIAVPVAVLIGVLR
jgi:succinate dehydrogenase / fumarate reductase, cytochrome b subunit